MLKTIAIFFLALATVQSQQPHDYYHNLHLPHSPPLYPVFERAPPTQFTCEGRSRKSSQVEQSLATVQSQQPHDYYHNLHLPHSPPLYPVFERAPPTQFTCEGRSRGYYADVQAGCQAYHLCWRQHLISTDLCTNGTLFNEQFQVCDHFYNVRCGSPYEDL